jgi:hypothetical protein
LFNDGSGGLPGNDDLGSMSAWFVWAALGMYPTAAGSDVLALHGPLFPSIAIHRPGTDITITAPAVSATNLYVQGVALDGTPSARPWLRYTDLVSEISTPESPGHRLTYTMGADSGSAWGTAPADAPPSAGSPTPAPELGPNLAAGGTATGSASCATGEETGQGVRRRPWHQVVLEGDHRPVAAGRPGRHPGRDRLRGQERRPRR